MCFAINITFVITKPDNTATLFGPWLRSFARKQSTLVIVGVAAFCWAL
jgi:hypothetical protein